MYELAGPGEVYVGLTGACHAQAAYRLGPPDRRWWQHVRAILGYSSSPLDGAAPRRPDRLTPGRRRPEPRRACMRCGRRRMRERCDRWPNPALRPRADEFWSFSSTRRTGARAAQLGSCDGPAALYAPEPVALLASRFGTRTTEVDAQELWARGGPMLLYALAHAILEMRGHGRHPLAVRRWKRISEARGELRWWYKVPWDVSRSGRSSVKRALVQAMSAGVAWRSA